jgi:hypothetical protein
MKRGLISSKKTIVLCCPRSISDIQLVFESFFVLEPSKPTLDSKTIPFLGQIAHNAVKG